MQIQDWMSQMEATMQHAQNLHDVGSSKPTPLLQRTDQMMMAQRLKLAPDQLLV